MEARPQSQEGTLLGTELHQTATQRDQDGGPGNDLGDEVWQHSKFQTDTIMYLQH